MKKLFACFTAALLLMQSPNHIGNFAVNAIESGAGIVTAADAITDTEIIEIMTAYFAEHELDAVCFYAETYEPSPDFAGKIVVEFNYTDQIGVNYMNDSTQLKEFLIAQNIPTDRIRVTALLNGKPCVTTTTSGSGTTRTTTATTIVEITDIEQIRAMLTAYVEENELDARIVSDKEYPGYQPIVIEFNRDAEINAFSVLKDYIAEQKIDMTPIGIVPIINGMPITTVNPIMGTTITTTTTAIGTDDLVEADYRTQLEYDASPMKVGETRTVRFYHPLLAKMTSVTVMEVSKNISYTYESGSDTLTITALAPGKGRMMYIMGEGCAFGQYLNLEIVEGAASTTADSGQTTTNPVFVFWGNANCVDEVDVADAVLVARFTAEDQTANISMEGKINADVTHDGNINGDDTILILRYIAKLVTFTELAP